MWHPLEDAVTDRTSRPPAHPVRAAAIGCAAGAALGALLATAMLLLVDFTRVPRDLLVLTLYAVVPLGVAGALAAVLVAAILALRSPSHDPWAALRRLSILAFGAVAVVAFAGSWVVLRRPTVVFSAATLVPIAACAGVVVWLAVRRSPAGRAGLAPATAIAIALAAVVLPPLAGWLRPTLVGQPPPGNLDVVRMPAPPGRRVLLLGWDGATWDVLDPLLDRGRMPALRALLARGSRGEIRAAPQAIQPFANSASAGARTPALWETVATGKPPLHHGIWDFECQSLPGVVQAVPFRITGDRLGGMLPTTGEMARAERLWHMLDRAGVTTGVVGWPNTWPADRPPAHGVVSSTQAHQRVPWNVAPEGAVDAIALCAGTEAEAIAAERTIFGLPGDASGPKPWETAATPLEADLLQAFYWDYNNDLCNVRVARELAGRRRPEFLAVYLSLVDIVQHKFWRYYQPDAFGDVPAADVARYGTAIPNAYDFFDRQLATLLDAMGPDTTVILLADHGAGPWVFDGLQGFVEEFLRQSHPEYSGNHRLNGIFAAAGPGIAPGATAVAPRHEDVTPTVLRLFGLPTARDLGGRVLDEILDPAVGTTPPPTIATYQTASSLGGLRPSASPFNVQVEDRLRALGYIQ